MCDNMYLFEVDNVAAVIGHRALYTCDDVFLPFIHSPSNEYYFFISYVDVQMVYKLSALFYNKF